jgi:hypothetical protein
LQKIETEKMLIAMVETELEKRRAEGRYMQASEDNLTSLGKYY